MEGYQPGKSSGREWRVPGAFETFGGSPPVPGERRTNWLSRFALFREQSVRSVAGNLYRKSSSGVYGALSVSQRLKVHEVRQRLCPAK